MAGVQINTTFRTKNKLDMATFMVRLVSMLKGIQLSKNEVLILSHFMLEGYNKVTKEHIVEYKLLTSPQSVANIVSKFKKYGLIVKDGFQDKLHPDLTIPIASIDRIKLILDLNNKS